MGDDAEIGVDPLRLLQGLLRCRLLVLQVGDTTRPTESLSYIGNDTFARADSRYIFDTRNGEPILRIDSPTSHYVLRALDE